MKAVLIPLVGALCLAGCHTTRQKDAAPAGAAATASSPASESDKSIQKARNAMLDKSMDIQDQRWAASPATATTAATPASAASSGKSPSSTPDAPPKDKLH